MRQRLWRHRGRAWVGVLGTLTAVLVLGGAALYFAGPANALKLLSQVSPTDPFTFGAVGLCMIVATLLACYIPARRATKVNPLVALRYE